jgi:hypothetical protein
MDVQLLLVPYDTARRGWRCGAGPEHLMNAGLIDQLHAGGHRVVGTQLIEDDPAQSPAEIRTAFELMRRLATAVRGAHAAGHFPLILSGNCNVGAVGALSGLTPAARSVFWLTPTGSPTRPIRPAAASWTGWDCPSTWVGAGAPWPLRCRVPTRPSRSDLSARSPRPRPSRSGLVVRLPGKPDPRLPIIRPVRPVRPARRWWSQTDRRLSPPRPGCL